MHGVELPEPRRRVIATARGDATALEFGPADRAIDVLFLHANGFNACTYRGVLAPSAGGARILAVDLRGHGLNRMATQTDGHSWRVYADDLRALLAALDEPPRVLAGHSMGATTVLLALPFLQAPPRAVLFDPVLAPREAYAAGVPDWETAIGRAAARRKDGFASREAAFQLYRGRGAFATWPDNALQNYLLDGLALAEDGQFRLACAPSWEAANFAAYCVADPYAALDAARTSISIFRAKENSTCHYAPPAAVDISLEVVPGTTHFLPMERPDIVAAGLRSAIA